jgi:hypothetical protein
MTKFRRAAAMTLLLAQASPSAAQQKPGWFTPPPASARTAAPTVDMTQQAEVEAITIIAQRASRSWRSQPPSERLNDPMSSDAARHSASFVPARPYCNEALRTVGGQPASAADMVAGSAAGGC